MSHEIKFKKPSQAMRYCMGYNAHGVRQVLKLARESKEWTLDTFRMAFAFAAIQGYPVVCFYNCMKAKNLAQ